MTWQVDSLLMYLLIGQYCRSLSENGHCSDLFYKENVIEWTGVEQLFCIIRICQGATWLPWKTHIAPCTSPQSTNNIDIDRDFLVN